MGTYDPKSRRHSPAAGEDAPAAVDAMLGDSAEGSELGSGARPAVISPPTIVAKVDPAETGQDTAETGQDNTEQPVAPAIVDLRDDLPAEARPRVYVEDGTATGPGSRRRWLIVAALVSVVLVIWVIRRRR